MKKLHEYAALRSLKYPAFRYLWLSVFLWAAANWMQRLAVSWLVLKETESPIAVSMVYAFNFMPNLFLGPFAGVILDRVNRKHMLVVIQLAAGLSCLAIAVAALMGSAHTWFILTMSGVFGVSVAFNIPTVPSMVFDIVEPQDALNANALRTIAFRIMGIIGSAVGGVLVAVIGVGGTVLTSSVIFGLAAFNTALIRYQGPKREVARKSVMREMWEGFRYFSRNGAVGSMIVAAMFAEAFGFGMLALVPFFANEGFLDVGSEGLGVMQGMVGLGGGIAGVFLATYGKQGRRGWLLVIGFVFYSVFVGIFGASNIFALSMAMLLGFGLAAGLFDMTIVVLLQANVPQEMRGRVMGAWTLALGFGPVGALLLGLWGELWGVRVALYIGSAILAAAAVALIATPWVRRLA
ncbi:MAG: MFS transporter [SAR202 cluster bacterium]|nr:MFS transporter [SAR202 cluster bacterium]